jgi:hypothetical protein
MSSYLYMRPFCLGPGLILWLNQQFLMSYSLLETIFLLKFIFLFFESVIYKHPNRKNVPFRKCSVCAPATELKTILLI